MSLLHGPMCLQLKGNKEQSMQNDIKVLELSTDIAIPLLSGANEDVEVLVKEGDKVFIGDKIAQFDHERYEPIFASVSGKVKGIEKRMHASLKQVAHVIITPDKNQKSKPPFQPLDYKKIDREKLLEVMKQAGIIGLGGAGFASYLKYEKECMQHLIINAVECEPYISADTMSIAYYAQTFVTGVCAMQKLAGVKDVSIALKENNKQLQKTLITLFKGKQAIHIKTVKDVYPMGWERTLVKTLLQQEYRQFPIERGIVVNNASSAIAFGNVLLQGMPIVSRIVTVSGDGIHEPSTVLVPVGMRVDQIIEACGGYTAQDVKLIAGGPMMGKTIVNDQFVIDRASNAITVLKNHPHQSVACLRCGKCIAFCPAGIQPVRIATALKSKDNDSLKKLHVHDCIDCGLCAYVCPSRLNVSENVRKAKRHLALIEK